MKSIVIIDVPDFAEGYKFWVVEFVNDSTRRYVTGFLDEIEALKYFNESANNDVLSIIYK